MAVVAALHNALVEDYSEKLRPGETRFIVVVATRLDQAREFIRVVRELLEQSPDPDLAALVDTAASTQDEVVFKHGVVLRALPCSSRSVRGLACSMVIFDEFAHFLTDTDGYQAGRAVWRALAPSVAQFGSRGYIMVTSTPLWPSGPFYELWRAAETGADPELFAVRAPTWELNPSIPRSALEGEFLSDPEGAAREYGAEFGDGSGALLDAVAVYNAVVRGRRELPAAADAQYVAAADPAFAAGGDAFTFAIAHRVGRGEGATIVLDRLEAWRGKRSPLNSDVVLDDIAAIARTYRIGHVLSDQYAAIPLADGLRRRGVVLKTQPLTAELKADVFGSLKRALNTGRLELLDDQALLAELVNLEVRPTPSGKPRIAAARGLHDDRAMAVATVVHALTDRIRPLLAVAFPDEDD